MASGPPQRSLVEVGVATTKALLSTIEMQGYEHLNAPFPAQRSLAPLMRVHSLTFLHCNRMQHMHCLLHSRSFFRRHRM
jgi:hypothetical protein